MLLRASFVSRCPSVVIVLLLCCIGWLALWSYVDVLLVTSLTSLVRFGSESLTPVVIACRFVGIRVLGLIRISARGILWRCSVTLCNRSPITDLATRGVMLSSS